MRTLLHIIPPPGPAPGDSTLFFSAVQAVEALARHDPARRHEALLLCGSDYARAATTLGITRFRRVPPPLHDAQRCKGSIERVLDDLDADAALLWSQHEAPWFDRLRGLPARVAWVNLISGQVRLRGAAESGEVRRFWKTLAPAPLALPKPPDRPTLRQSLRLGDAGPVAGLLWDDTDAAYRLNYIAAVLAIAENPCAALTPRDFHGVDRVHRQLREGACVPAFRTPRTPMPVLLHACDFLISTFPADHPAPFAAECALVTAFSLGIPLIVQAGTPLAGRIPQAAHICLARSAEPADLSRAAFALLSTPASLQRASDAVRDVPQNPPLAAQIVAALDDLERLE